MSTDLYKNRRELFSGAQEAALAPQGGLLQPLKEMAGIISPQSGVVLQPGNSQWEAILIIIAVIC